MVCELCQSFITDLQGIPINNLVLKGVTHLPNDAFAGLDFVSLPFSSFLELVHNNLGIIPPHAFRGMHSPPIMLDLSANNLTVFPGEALSYFTDLRYLSIQRNNFTEIPDGAFNQFPIFTLYIGNNPIRNLNREGVLSGLESSLKILDLMNLNLMTFPIALLKNLRKLNYVRLHNNLIETLPANMLEDFKTTQQLSILLNKNRIYDVSRHFLRGSNIKMWQINLEDNLLTKLDFIDICSSSLKFNLVRHKYFQPVIYLYGNPLQCDCGLRSLLNKRHVTIEGHCVSPAALEHVSFYQVKERGYNVTRNNDTFSCPRMRSLDCNRTSLPSLIRTSVNTGSDTDNNADSNTDNDAGNNTGNGFAMMSLLLTVVYVISMYSSVRHIYL